MTTGVIIGIVVAVIVVVLVLILAVWYVSLYNKLQRLKNLVEEGWSTIDVQLKKRYDLVPNLVETVKGYAKHESGTLEAVIAARNAAVTATGEDKIAAENALSGTLKSLFALKEAYPELKANTNFIDLQNQLKAIENEIASARRYYNGTVKELNTKIDVFPSNIVAKRIGLEKRSYFELDSSEERANPQVKF
ncbi:MAG: LemA family protein [Clostridia bacterium]|nr:LemA family protein [Clostridia bacterium]